MVHNKEVSSKEIGQNFGLLIKPSSAECNLRCEYCFYRDRSSDPYRDTVFRRMSDQVLESMISQYLHFVGKFSSFSWQGGEPLLMGIDFFKRVIELQEKHGFPGQLIGNTIQTNGTLITHELADLFHRYNFLIGISLDGPEEYHDLYRKDAKGQGSFKRVMEGISTLKEHKVEFNILAVVNDVTVHKPDETYSFFVENGFGYLQYIPVVEFDKETHRLTPHSVDANNYGDFLCRLFDLWYNKGEPIVSIRMFDNILAVYAGLKPESCMFMERCGTYAVVEYNGDVYPCDFFVEPSMFLGNLMEVPLENIVHNRKMRHFSAQKRQKATGNKCLECEWEFICHFGCQHHRIDGKADQLCQSYAKFFQYSQERFKMLAKRLTSDQEVQKMANIPGRNDPCPCGSGKKYKKCCMGRQYNNIDQ